MTSAEFQMIMERFDRLEALLVKENERILETPEMTKPNMRSSFRQRCDEAMRRAAAAEIRKAERKKRKLDPK